MSGHHLNSNDHTTSGRAHDDELLNNTGHTRDGQTLATSPTVTHTTVTISAIATT
jgi:hypothetical protein